jgi:hypothetical protein
MPPQQLAAPRFGSGEETSECRRRMNVEGEADFQCVGAGKSKGKLNNGEPMLNKNELEGFLTYLFLSAHYHRRLVFQLPTLEHRITYVIVSSSCHRVTPWCHLVTPWCRKKNAKNVHSSLYFCSSSLYFALRHFILLLQKTQKLKNTPLH